MKPSELESLMSTHLQMKTRYRRKTVFAPGGGGCLGAQSCPTPWPHGPQPSRPRCPSPPPRACSDSCPLNGWCHPTISSSVVPFSSCLSQNQGLFQWVGFSHQVEKSLELQLQHQFFRLNIQDWFSLGLTSLILLSKGLMPNHDAFLPFQPQPLQLQYSCPQD